MEERAINFILDADFDHYVPLEMSVEFIVKTFNQLGGSDLFGLTNLGDPNLSIKLEAKNNNLKIKENVLKNLEEMVEELMI